MFRETIRAGRWVEFFAMIIKLNGHEVAYAYGYLANAQGLSSNEPVTRFLPGEQKITLLQSLDFVEKTSTTLNLDFTLAHVPRLRQIIESATSYGDLM